MGSSSLSVRRSGAGMAAAVALHGAVAGALLAVDPVALQARSQVVVEIDVREPPAPPPPPPEAPPTTTPPPPAAERPRIVSRRMARVVPEARPEPSPAPPPPNQDPPPTAAPAAPPVFGVTLDSVVTGDAAMAVAVGNTLMTKDRTPAKPTQTPQPYAAEGARPFTPVAEVYITQHPVVLHEERSESSYPPEARKMGIEGRVKLSVGIDEKGNVAQVKILERAGHGFDEVATKAMWKFKFSPARTSDGRAVPHRLTYVYRFTQPR